MSKSKKSKEESELFKTLPDGDLIERRSILHREVQVLMSEKNMKVGTIHRISKELEERQHSEAERIAVTDHAVVRYLERMEGFDLEGTRQKIMEMARRSVRRDNEFMDDPVTGMIVVRKKGSDSIATIMDGDAVKR